MGTSCGGKCLEQSSLQERDQPKFSRALPRPAAGVAMKKTSNHFLPARLLLTLLACSVLLFSHGQAVGDWTIRNFEYNGLGSNVVRGVYAKGDNVYAATDAGLSISGNGGENFTINYIFHFHF